MQPFYSTTVIRRGSPFKEHVVLAFAWMRETGILKYQQDFWDEGKPLCNLDEIDYTSVGINDVISAYKVLMCGMALSLAALALEIIIKFVITKCKFAVYSP